jgi:hypothetical protein
MFGKNKKEEKNNEIKLTDKGEIKEVEKIKDRLDPGEVVHIVAKQSRVKPGGSVITTPNTIFITDTRLIIRNPTMLGMRENFEDFSFDKLTTIKLEKGVFSSTLVITAPGMGTAARPGLGSGLIAWGRGEDGTIDAIPKDKAELILHFIRDKMEKIRTQNSQQTNNGNAGDDPLTLLKKRFVMGEITKEEFEDMKKILE